MPQARRTLAALLLLGLLAAAPPAAAWLLQAQTNPRLETRIDQSRAIAREYERAFRDAYGRARTQRPIDTACTAAHEAALTRVHGPHGWRLAARRSDPPESVAGRADGFRHPVRLDGLPDACVASGTGTTVMITREPRPR